MKNVNSITFLRRDLHDPCAMIFIAAFARLSAAPEAPAHALLASSRAALGHLGLTIIALVFVLLTLCKG